MGNVVRIGLDIAKSVFQVHGVDANGKTVRASSEGWFVQRETVPPGQESEAP